MPLNVQMCLELTLVTCSGINFHSHKLHIQYVGERKTNKKKHALGNWDIWTMFNCIETKSCMSCHYVFYFRIDSLSIFWLFFLLLIWINLLFFYIWQKKKSNHVSWLRMGRGGLDPLCQALQHKIHNVVCLWTRKTRKKLNLFTN